MLHRRHGVAQIDANKWATSARESQGGEAVASLDTGTSKTGSLRLGDKLGGSASFVLFGEERRTAALETQ